MANHILALLGRLSVRWRLLLAFFGISAFAVIAAVASLYSFAEVGQVLGRITQERVPSALASLELSRQAERIVAAAPALLAVTTASQHAEVSGTIASEVSRLEELLGELNTGATYTVSLGSIESVTNDLRRNLDALDALIADRLAVRMHIGQRLQRLTNINNDARRLVAPGILVMDSKLAELRRFETDSKLAEDERRRAVAVLSDEILSFLPQQKGQIELATISDSLLRAASAETSADLSLLEFPIKRAIGGLENLANDFDIKLIPRLRKTIGDFKELVEGPESLFEARAEELAILAQAEALLAENSALSRELTAALDQLVQEADRDIAEANREVGEVQEFNTVVLIAVVLSSLVCSGLIVWFYVDRNLIARLSALSRSMLAVAGGNLRVPLPPADGADEITEMTRALTVFRDTAIEIEDKGLREMEVLSGKLAKYLSPQVYASIFTGQQEVKLASRRKKLTVFFSDIAGFTETTENLESEELTQLLNQYLTEMSRVALEYGGTIDKYVGDAIMIFFGDPESKGVKEDALACVHMAIAMQKRMQELSAAWRDTGIERPLICRIGIHTGFCTVGNFGSEDRMDYTIIGGAVNLASRLEHEAVAGGILISYETYAHVKEAIHCEPMGSIQVRGIRHPVTTYQVIDLYANQSNLREPMQAELPHLQLRADPEKMSTDERRQAIALLQEALERLQTVIDKPANI